VALSAMKVGMTIGEPVENLRIKRSLHQEEE